MLGNSSVYANLSEYQMSYTAYLGTGIYVAFVGILSTLGNLIVIVVICGKRKTINFQKKHHIPLLLNLAVADIGVSVFGYPYTSLSGFAGRWLFTDELCTMAAFFCFLLSLVSLSSLVAVSIIRYIVICKPGLKPRLTSRMTTYTILLTWLYGLTWAVIPLFGPAAYTYEAFGTSCSINWTRRFLQDTIFVLCADVLCFLIPLAIIATCYVRIILRYRMISAPSTTGYDNSNSFTNMKARRDMRVTWLVMVQVGCFITVWTPYVVVSGLSMVYSLPVWVTVLPTMFAKLSCAVNPITYSLLNRTFRRMSRDILCKCALRKVNHSSDKYHPSNRHPWRTTRHHIFCVSESVTEANNSSMVNRDESLASSPERQTVNPAPSVPRVKVAFERSFSMPPVHTPGDYPGAITQYPVPTHEIHNMTDVQRETTLTLLRNKREVTRQVSGKPAAVNISDLDNVLHGPSFGRDVQSIKMVSVADIILRQTSDTRRQNWPSNRVSCKRCGAPERASVRRHSD